MRIIFQSCASLFALSAFLAGCASDGRQTTSYSGPPDGAIMQETDFGTAEDGLKLAASLRKAGANGQAFSVLARAHRRYPDHAGILSAYGRQALVIGKDDLAARVLRQALRTDPEDWRALSARAVLEGRQGRHATARRSLGQAQSLSSGRAAVLNNLGMNYLLEGEAQQAARLFRRALIAPGADRAVAERVKRNLAVALAVSGDFETADRLAARSLPRRLKGARGGTIARFMGVNERPALRTSEWTPRLADARRYISGGP